MQNPYEQRLRDRIDRIYPGGFQHLSYIQDFPEDAARRILEEIIKTGCLSQNEANITAARRAISRLPAAWVTARFPDAAALCLFREPEWREWEFRRAAEMLQGRFPESLAWLIGYAGKLNDPEVDEAVSEFL